MCEETTELEYREDALPAASRVRVAMRDGSESQRAATISDCREAPGTAPVAADPEGKPVPRGLRVVVQFDRDNDTDVAAADDEISATVALPAVASGRNIDAGSKVTGRIVQMVHAGRQFFISPPAVETGWHGHKLTGHGMEDWPYGTLAFPASKGKRYVVPAGFKSTWLTVTAGRL